MVPKVARYPVVFPYLCMILARPLFLYIRRCGIELDRFRTKKLSPVNSYFLVPFVNALLLEITILLNLLSFFISERVQAPTHPYSQMISNVVLDFALICFKILPKIYNLNLISNVSATPNGVCIK